MGASGFVGSHVTRRAVARGDDVRVYLRRSSSTIGIDDLDVERSHGDLHDAEALRAAMSDRDVVFYCVVDTRFNLRDPAPLFETNVESLRRVLDIATKAQLFRFVFCSTIGTIAIATGPEPVTEDMPFNWSQKGGAYIESRRRAEDMVMRYARDDGLPAVAMCVSNPYGPLDFQPHQGLMVQMAALGKVPVYLKGVSTEVVGIEDVLPRLAKSQHPNKVRSLLKSFASADEVAVTGLEAFLASKGDKAVTAEEVEKHLAGNGLQMRETVRGIKPVNADYAKSEEDFGKLNQKLSPIRVWVDTLDETHSVKALLGSMEEDQPGALMSQTGDWNAHIDEVAGASVGLQDQPEPRRST